jgi:serine/threonine-protein kinase
MVMELMRGGTVGERLKAGRHFSDETALRWLAEAAGALDAAHAAGIVHRDVKPGNLLLDDHERLAIADFGIARIAVEDQLTQTGQVLGTAAYIAPEQAMGHASTAASDRYALAVVAFELLTGTRPFEAEHFAAQARAHVEDEPPPASERDPDLPASVDAVLARGMAKEPSDRWESAADMVAALGGALGSTAPAPAPAPPGTESTRPLPPSEPPRRPAALAAPSGDRPRRRTGALLLGGLAVLALLAVGAVLLLAGGNDDPPAAGNDNEPTAAERRAERREQREREATPTATAEPTQEATPEATREATPEPTPEATEEPAPEASGTADLDRAAQLQVEGYNARQAGDFEQALELNQQALEACGDTQQLSPCGYALFEVGAALNALGRPDEAIPVLEQRLDVYGDNDAGEVKRELKAARKAARGGGD